MAFTYAVPASVVCHSFRSWLALHNLQYNTGLTSLPARCDAVLQASVCLKLDGNADTTACTRKPYCVYEFDVLEARRVCMHRDTAARAADAYSKKLVKLKVCAGRHSLKTWHMSTAVTCQHL
jgi:hypothetical protein